MTEKKVILVTGVAGYWGRRVAVRLLREESYHVICLDTEPPDREIKGLDFVPADVRNPVLAELLKSEGVETICHLQFVEASRLSERAFNMNVMGTTKLLGAAAEAGVGKVVLKSSTAIYGARPSNSAFLTEDHALRGSRRNGTIRHLMEIESFCNGFRHKEPSMTLTTLRFCSIIGPTVDTPMTRFLKEPTAPTLLGFDPRMQLIHEDDVLEALVHAVVNDVPGAFNIAAEDVLPLNKIRALAGKLPLSVFHLFAYWGVSRLGRNSQYLPIELDYIRYPWVGDLTKMRDELGFAPRFTAEEAVREFAEHLRVGDCLSESHLWEREEEQLRDIMEQRRQTRKRRAATATGAEEGGDDD
jgi:UDP-glucose 4-epimerase